MRGARDLVLTVVLGTAFLTGAAERATAAAISVTSATVNQPGDVAQVCAVLSGSGGQIAGTQNDLEWDGTCATLPEPAPCSEVPGHPKRLSKTISRDVSFRFRGIMLSFGDIDPMPDGPMYCCRFQVEADPGRCCQVRVVGAAGSSPGGEPIAVSNGSPGQLCTKGSDPGRSGGFGSGQLGGNQPLSASNAPADAGPAGVAPAAPPPAQPGASGAAPPAQVLPGGGAPRPPVGSEETGRPAAPVEAPPAALPPTAPVAPPASTPQRPVAPPTLAQASTAAPTAAQTEAPTAPADTPTRRVAAATPARQAATPADAGRAPGAADARPAAPAAADRGGWFGCQIGTAAGIGPILALIAVGALVAGLRRRAARRR